MKPYLILAAILLVILTGVIAFKLQQNPDVVVASMAKQAIQKKDPTLCNSLPQRTEESRDPEDGKGSPSVSYPRNQCLLSYLHEAKDRQVCDLLNGQDDAGSKEHCYNFIAEVYQDPVVCQKLAGTAHSWKSIPICIAVAKRDVHECDILAKEEAHLSYSPKTDCILEVVRRTKDYTICSGITGPGYGTFGMEGADSDRNRCLEIGGCDKPDKRRELCALMRYPSYMLPEEKAQCLTQTWECPDA